jgi:hypothetical protein
VEIAVRPTALAPTRFNTQVCKQVWVYRIEHDWSPSAKPHWDYSGIVDRESYTHCNSAFWRTQPLWQKLQNPLMMKHPRYAQAHQ